jgi:hypothetical protein
MVTAVGAVGRRWSRRRRAVGKGAVLVQRKGDEGGDRLEGFGRDAAAEDGAEGVEEVWEDVGFEGFAFEGVDEAFNYA